MSRAEHLLQQLMEKAAPGFEGTVLHMKKHRNIDNPWALSHWLAKRGAKSHYTKTGKPKRTTRKDLR